MKHGFVAALLCLLACSKSTTLTSEQLASEQKQLRSLDAEVALLMEVAARGHVTRHFVRGHVEQLRQTIEEHRKKLSQATPPPGAEPQLARLRAGYDSLDSRLP
jgi:sigma54-dependent transcription regulator